MWLAELLAERLADCLSGAAAGADPRRRTHQRLRTGKPGLAL